MTRKDGDSRLKSPECVSVMYHYFIFARNSDEFTQDTSSSKKYTKLSMYHLIIHFMHPVRTSVRTVASSAIVS